MKIKSKFTMLVGEDKTTIEIKDADAAITFVRLELTPDQLCKALSRLSMVSCVADVYGLDKIGKKHECKTHEFAFPEGVEHRNKGVAFEMAVKTCPEGWTPENYFNSQDSFYRKDGEQWARCTIRRWV